LRLLADESLPPRLVRELADLFPDSFHVKLTGLTSAADDVVWEYAKTHGFTLITKDRDFAGLSMAWGAPPKIILLQTGNCSTTKLIQIIRKNAIRLSEFENDVKRSLLILR
jgi:predicted nuclease of predicted toxin-antitoxin system